MNEHIERLKQTYWYEVVEAFCRINAAGKLQHTTNQELGIADDVGEGLEDVAEYISNLLQS